MKIRKTGENKANLGIRGGDLKNFKLPDGQEIIQNPNNSPLSRLIENELPQLLAALNDDPKYRNTIHVRRIQELLADPEFQYIERTTFVNPKISK